MSEEKKPQLSLLWFIYAFVYDVILLLEPYTTTMHTVCNILNEKQTHAILDAGCGTGNLALFAAKHGINTTTGVDSSAGMLFVARLKKRIFRRQLQHCTFMHGDLETGEGIPKQQFDAVVSFGVLHAVSDPMAVTRQLASRLKPGGLLILVLPLPVSMKLIIYDHIKTAGIIRLLLSILALPLFAITIIVNLLEEAWQKKGHLHFMTKNEANQLITDNNLSLLTSELTFGNAYTLIVAKSPEHE
jgi:ubiquinone/menaquinone biosynthesis C-methylase UbiE